MKLQSLDDVLRAELSDLLSAEKQLVKALPKVADAASSTVLREAIEHHLDETRGHVQRLEKVFESLGTDAQSEHCEAMEGLIAEGKEIIEAEGDGQPRTLRLSVPPSGSSTTRSPRTAPPALSPSSSARTTRPRCCRRRSTRRAPPIRS